LDKDNVAQVTNPLHLTLQHPVRFSLLNSYKRLPTFTVAIDAINWIKVKILKS
jgi:hypothetical protein